MSRTELLQAVQEVMNAQFQAGLSAGKLNVIINTLHPEPEPEPAPETPTEEPSNES